MNIPCVYNWLFTTLPVIAGRVVIIITTLNLNPCGEGHRAKLLTIPIYYFTKIGYISIPTRGGPGADLDLATKEKVWPTEFHEQIQ